MVYQQLSYSSHGGISEVLRNRPPTVMFLLCIASCALATMSISFYFKLTNEEVSNISNKSLSSVERKFLQHLYGCTNISFSFSCRYTIQMFLDGTHYWQRLVTWIFVYWTLQLLMINILGATTMDWKKRKIKEPCQKAQMI